MTDPRLGGWRLEAPDAGDYLLENRLASLDLKEGASGGSVDLRKWCSPVENQRELGSCVANAVVGALELLQIRDGIPYVDLSRLFVYYNSRLMHMEADKDAGTYIRLAMGTLSSLGVCAEAKWPYDTSNVFVRPTWGSYREAYANKIDSYYRIGSSGNDRIEAIKTALQSRHPVVFGMKVDRDFQQTGADGVVLMPKQNRVSVGGHAMLIVGYKDDGATLIVRNSWGASWGDHGYCYVPSGYLSDADANDFWVPFRY